MSEPWTVPGVDPLETEVSSENFNAKTTTLEEEFYAESIRLYCPGDHPLFP